MTKTLKGVVFIPHVTEITRARILQDKDAYGLSWSDFNRELQYTKGSQMIYRIVRDLGKNPARVLKPKFVERYKEALARIERRCEHLFELTVTANIKTLPKHFRIAGAPVRCKGHKEFTFNLPASGYCDAECKTLSKKQGQRKNKMEA